MDTDGDIPARKSGWIEMWVSALLANVNNSRSQERVDRNIVISYKNRNDNSRSQERVDRNFAIPCHAFPQLFPLARAGG